MWPKNVTNSWGSGTFRCMLHWHMSLKRASMQTIPAIKKTNSASFFHFVYFLCHARVSATFSEIVSKNKHSGVFAIFLAFNLHPRFPCQVNTLLPLQTAFCRKMCHNRIQLIKIIKRMFWQSMVHMYVVRGPQNLVSPARFPQPSPLMFVLVGHATPRYGCQTRNPKNGVAHADCTQKDWLQKINSKCPRALLLLWNASSASPVASASCQGSCWTRDLLNTFK